MSSTHSTVSGYSTVVTSESSPASNNRLTIQLRPRTRTRVQWDPDVVDNEDMGKKSSKICCIYHAPDDWNNSSTSDESSDDEFGEMEDLSKKEDGWKNTNDHHQYSSTPSPSSGNEPNFTPLDKGCHHC